MLRIGKTGLPTPKDIRAARAYLGWTQKELGNKCGLSGTAITNIEKELSIPTSKNLDAITEAFWKAEIEFREEGGFRPRQDLIRVLEGEKGALHFFNDIVMTAKRPGSEFLISNSEESLFFKTMENIGITQPYFSKMKSLQHNFTFRILINDEDENPVLGSYVEYHVMPKEKFSEKVPFYIYGGKFAIILWDKLKFIVHNDPDLTEAYRKQFYFMWENSKPLPKGKGIIYDKDIK